MLWLHRSSARARQAMATGRALLMSGGIALCGCRAGAPALVTLSHDGPPERCADTSATPRVPEAARSALPPRDPARTPDHLFATLASELPGGFAGVYVEPLPGSRSRPDRRPDQHRTVIRLQDTLLAPDARDALYARLRAHYGPDFRLADVRLQSSRWSFAQLDEWWRYLTPTLFARGMVHMADIDESRNRLVFITATERARREARSLLDSLSVPCGLVVLMIGPIDQLITRATHTPANSSWSSRPSY